MSDSDLHERAEHFDLVSPYRDIPQEWLQLEYKAAVATLISYDGWIEHRYILFGWRYQSAIPTLVRMLREQVASFETTKLWTDRRWDDAMYSQSRTQFERKRKGKCSRKLRLAFDTCMMAGEFALAYQLVDDHFATRNMK